MATTPDLLFSTVKRLLQDARLPQELTEHLKLSPPGTRGHSGSVVPSSFAIGTAAQVSEAVAALPLLGIVVVGSFDVGWVIAYHRDA